MSDGLDIHWSLSSNECLDFSARYLESGCSYPVMVAHVFSLCLILGKAAFMAWMLLFWSLTP